MISMLIALLVPTAQAAVPPFVYLTWQRADTSHTMTVNYHSEVEQDKVSVYFDTAAHGGDLGKYRFRSTGSSQVLETPRRRVHRVDLLPLLADTVYYFVLGDGTRTLTAERKFRTPADGGQTYTFVTGGDMGGGDEVRILLKQAAARSPLFGLIGGDIAYENGVPSQYDRWDEWLSNWTTYMVTPEGFTIPIVAAVGNHEVQGGYGGTWDLAPFYTQYLAQEPRRSYFSRRFGSNSVFYMLDTGHLAPQSGAQSEWLEREMTATAQVPYRFAIYHVPLFPSVRAFDDKDSKAGRDGWLRLFDHFSLSAAFENHEHALKRTHPLIAGQPAAGGTVYFGDGCFGKTPRATDPSRPYLAHSEGTRHFWAVNVTPQRAELRAIDSEGNVRDASEVLPRAR